MTCRFNSAQTLKSYIMQKEATQIIRVFQAANAIFDLHYEYTAVLSAEVSFISCRFADNPHESYN